MSFSTHPQTDEFVEFVEELADAARELLATRLEAGRFETKADASPVTEFDRGVESTLRDMIRARYPDHGIIGEEFPPEREDAEFVWIMDPIDGTKPFVVGIPVFTTLIALCRDGAPVIGAIDSSATGDRWLGVEGRVTVLNGRELSTSGRTELDGATLGWSQPDRILPEHLSGHAELTDRVAWTVFGAAALGFGRLAAGSLDIAVCSGSIGAYDVCALVPIVEGAGGRITDGDDRPITIRDPKACVAAATPELHAATLRVLKGPEMRIALIRHGQTDWNLHGRMQGRTDIPLNETGRVQALETAYALAAADADWELAVSGPLGRVRETAAIIATHLGLPHGTTYDDLTEKSYGLAEGEIIASVIERWPGGDIPEMEPNPDIGPRGVRALEAIRREHEGRDLIAVTHGELIQGTLAHIAGLPYDAFLDIPNASVSVIDHTGEGWRVHSVCGTAFEPGLPA